jgi:hypothetical protein
MPRKLTVRQAERIARSTAQALVLPPLASSVARETLSNSLQLLVELTHEPKDGACPTVWRESSWVRFAGLTSDQFDERCRITWTALVLCAGSANGTPKRKFALRTV